MKNLNIERKLLVEKRILLGNYFLLVEVVFIILCYYEKII